MFYPTDRTLSISNLLEIIHEHAQKGALSSLGLDAVSIDVIDLEMDLNAVSKDEPLIKKLIEIRNQYFAHRTAQLVASGTFESLPELNAKDLLTLRTKASTIVDKYGRLCGRRLMATGFPGRDDYNHMFDLLRTGLISKQAKRQL